MSEEDKNKIEYKISLIGDSSVGKTCIFKKLTIGVFLDKNISTIGMDRRTIGFEFEVEENGKTLQRKVDVSLVDTAGQERFKSITKNYFKGSDGIILMYDITNRESFQNVENWSSSIIDAIGNPANSKYLIILLGNKLDLVENKEKERKVTTEEAMKKCEECGFVWGGECSAKSYTMEKFKEMFNEYVIKIYHKVGTKIVRTQVVNKFGSAKKKKRRCFLG